MKNAGGCIPATYCQNGPKPPEYIYSCAGIKKIPIWPRYSDSQAIGRSTPEQAAAGGWPAAGQAVQHHSRHETKQVNGNEFLVVVTGD
uniref:Uncharacterized protein n=1 Tax=Leersia perrieri TaxID=77586 RepID=A0A0D9X230_9ORYZ